MLFMFAVMRIRGMENSKSCCPIDNLVAMDLFADARTAQGFHKFCSNRAIESEVRQREGTEKEHESSGCKDLLWVA